MGGGGWVGSDLPRSGSTGMSPGTVGGSVQFVGSVFCLGPQGMAAGGPGIGGWEATGLGGMVSDRRWLRRQRWFTDWRSPELAGDSASLDQLPSGHRRGTHTCVARSAH